MNGLIYNTPLATASFPHLIEKNEKGSYTMELLLPKKDYNSKKDRSGRTLEEYLTEFKKQTFGVINGKIKSPADLIVPVLDGDEATRKGVDADGVEQRVPREETKGHYIIKVTNRDEVRVVNANLEEVTDKSKIYGGCKVRVGIKAYYSSKYKRITFYMQGIQFVADGTPLASAGGGKVSIEDMFSDESSVAEGLAKEVTSYDEGI